MVTMTGLDCHNASSFGFRTRWKTQVAHTALIEINIAADDRSTALGTRPLLHLLRSPLGTNFQ
jgi:hypothetical protein